MAAHKLGLLQTLASCSVCLEAVTDANERSIAKLICGHFFHLDCIGSAFNAKGSMQCPNCRHVENGQWLYANGCRQRDELILEDIINEEEYDVFAEVSEIRYPHDLMQLSGEWCPYQGSYAQLSLSFGGIDTHIPAAYGGLLVTLVDEHRGDIEPGPYLQARRGAHVADEGTPMQEMPNPHAYLGVPEQYSSSRMRRASNTQAPIRARWSRPDIHQTMGTDFPLPHSSNRGERISASPQPPIARQSPIARQEAHRPERPLGSGAIRAGTSMGYNAPREAEPRFSQPAATPWVQEGSLFGLTMQYPTEPEVQRWVPPPLSGLYGLHSLPTSAISSAQGAYRAPVSNQFPAPFQPFQPFIADSNNGTFQHPFDNNLR